MKKFLTKISHRKFRITSERDQTSIIISCFSSFLHIALKLLSLLITFSITCVPLLIHSSRENHAVRLGCWSSTCFPYKVYLICLALGTVSGIEGQDGNQTQILEPLKILEWEAPKSLKNKFIYYLSGYDYDGKPVVVLEMGNWDIQSTAEKGGGDLALADYFIDQLNARLLCGYFGKKSNDSESAEDEVVVIVDFNGLKLKQFTSPTFKWLLERTSKMGIIHISLVYGFLVNVNPLAHQLLTTAKPFTGRRMEKVEIYGTNPTKWIPHILKRIPRSELHPAYGGNKDFRPVAVYG